MKKPKTIEKTTKIMFSDAIDTPYAYCVIPKFHFELMKQRIEMTQSYDVRPRSVLSVTTWDGRELFELGSVED